MIHDWKYLLYERTGVCCQNVQTSHISGECDEVPCFGDGFSDEGDENLLFVMVERVGNIPGDRENDAEL